MNISTLKFYLNKILKFIKSFIKIKNYIIPNIMAIFGYWFMISYHLEVQKEHQLPEELYDATGSIILLFSLPIFSILLTILTILEIYIRKKFFHNITLKFTIPKIIKITHIILFLIGFWLPFLSVLTCIYVLLYSIVTNIITSVTSFYNYWVF